MLGFGKKKYEHMDLRNPNFNFNVYARIYFIDSFYEIWEPEYLDMSSLFDSEDIAENKLFFSNLFRKYTDQPNAFKDQSREEYEKLTKHYQLIAELWERKYKFLGKAFEEHFAPVGGWEFYISNVNASYRR